MSFSLQVSISEAMTAQCSAPPSEPAKRAFDLRPSSIHFGAEPEGSFLASCDLLWNAV